MVLNHYNRSIVSKGAVIFQNDYKGMNIETDNLYMKSVFSTINRILKVLEHSMDDSSFNLDDFTAKKFGISENKFARILKLLIDDGYIEGVKVIDRGEPTVFDGADYDRFKVSIGDIGITLKGLKYLAENTVLANVYKTVKSVKDIMP